MRRLMSSVSDLEIFFVSPPGLEPMLLAEARQRKFRDAKLIAGGVVVRGGWPEVWRANLEMRGCSRVLVRLGAFRALHLAQLDKRARQFPWAEHLRRDVPVSIEATCKSSRIYHGGAAAQRIATAIREELGAPVADDAEVAIKVRIEDDMCTISVDSSGESLHKRGHKEAIGKAPMRETLAALFLRQCGFDGKEPVVDPMCGSGTFVIEAAEIAAGLQAGRARQFAFEKLARFDAARWAKMTTGSVAQMPVCTFFGSDRDAGAIAMSRANAERAGVSAFCTFKQQAVSDVMPPEGPAGLVIVNPPYGARIGDKKKLHGLYGALGQTLIKRFPGWRVGLVTTDTSLAKATGLDFLPPARSVLHGGLRVVLYQTKPLP